MFKRAHALFLAGDERSVEELEAARDALVAAGRREDAAEAEAFLAQLHWFRGEQAKVFPHVHAAEALVEGAPPSPGATRVLAWSARYRFLAGDLEDGLRRAEEARAMAERLGLDDLRVHALTTIGSAKEFSGDTTGRRDLENAVEIGRSSNSVMVAGALNNLAVVLDMTDLARVGEVQDEALREAERVGDAPLMRFLRGNLVPALWILGDWDRAMAVADVFIAECEQGSPHILEGQCRQIRGYIELARGQRDEALEDFARGLQLSQTGEPADRAQALIRSAWANLQVGRVSIARALFAEALPNLRKDPNARPWSMAEVACELGETADIREVLLTLPPSTGQRAMLAVLDGDFERRGRALRRRRTTGSSRRRPVSAQRSSSSRRAGPARARSSSSKRSSFYRSVGATLFVERGEALLAKTA